ncbi:MAG: VOC family protein [Moraxellaceae bacterium]|nr:VOC family protein [Moraxellaceae bacterium]
MPDFKPTGYNSVSPYLVVTDAAAMLRFMEQVFGAKLLRSYPGESGRIMHAEARIDDTVVMFADGNTQWPPIASNVHVYVPDVDETWRRALAAGGRPVQEPVQKQDEDKRGGVQDPGGTTWWISTQVG